MPQNRKSIWGWKLACRATWKLYVKEPQNDVWSTITAHRIVSRLAKNYACATIYLLISLRKTIAIASIMPMSFTFSQLSTSRRRRRLHRRQVNYLFCSVGIGKRRTIDGSQSNEQKSKTPFSHRWFLRKKIENLRFKFDGARSILHVCAPVNQFYWNRILYVLLFLCRYRCSFVRWASLWQRIFVSGKLFGIFLSAIFRSLIFVSIGFYMFGLENENCTEWMLQEGRMNDERRKNNKITQPLEHALTWTDEHGVADDDDNALARTHANGE